MNVLGIDIGGTGIKGAPVDISKGILLKKRLRIETPRPATPKAVADVVQEIAAHYKWSGPIGVTMPAVVKSGIVLTAAHIDKSWLDCDAAALFRKATGRKVAVVNDADAAGLAELHFGAGRNQHGLIMMVTLGTGIGTSLIFNQRLIPNSELGHIHIRGHDAERRASNRAREKKNLSWKKWGKQVDEYLGTLEALLWPDLFIVGGGASEKADRFFGFLNRRAVVKPAQLGNDAGIIGAAISYTK